MYHIYCNGYRITSSPMTLNEINKQYGSIQRLESEGFRLIKV